MNKVEVITLHNTLKEIHAALLAEQKAKYEPEKCSKLDKSYDDLLKFEEKEYNPMLSTLDGFDIYKVLINLSVIKAMAEMKSLDIVYYQATLESRSDAANGVGSRFNGCYDALAVENLLCSLHWEPYTHPAVAPDCMAYRADLPNKGKLGIVQLHLLQNNVKLVVRKGQIEAQAIREKISGESDFDVEVDYAVMIVGEEQGKLVMFTVHPGAPIPPQIYPADETLDGKMVSPAEAKELGLTHAKYVNSF